MSLQQSLYYEYLAIRCQYSSASQEYRNYYYHQLKAVWDRMDRRCKKAVRMTVNTIAANSEDL